MPQCPLLQYQLVIPNISVSCHRIGCSDFFIILAEVLVYIGSVAKVDIIHLHIV